MPPMLATAMTKIIIKIPASILFSFLSLFVLEVEVNTAYTRNDRYEN